MNYGKEMYQLAEKLFPICRSITGNGVRETLRLMDEISHSIIIHEVPSGTKVFDWTVPEEWNIKNAYIEDENGVKLIDFKKNNLHLVGYSTPVNCYMTKEELLQYIWVEDSQPDVIPYVTSYYKKRFGFCMSKNQRDNLKDGTYHVVIDSELKQGSLTYGEIILKGQMPEEIFISTYICHPSMANNELSGPCLSLYLSEWLKQRKNNYTYRFVFVPETIGAITYLSQNLNYLKKYVIAGFNLSCVGDDRTYSYIESRYGNNLADRVLQNVLKYHYPGYKRYTYLQRGSDERQYCSPGIDLPLAGFSRSKYEAYPEYHTSSDNLNLISPSGLQGAFEVMSQCITALEYNHRYTAACLCEPQLGKRGLYPEISKKGMHSDRILVDILAYADGTNDLIDISNRIGQPVKEILPAIEQLKNAGLIKEVLKHEN